MLLPAKTGRAGFGRAHLERSNPPAGPREGHVSRETPLGARARHPGNGSKRKSEPDKQANRPHEPAARPSSARRGRPRLILGRRRTSASRLERANSRAYSCRSALKTREPKRRSSPGLASKGTRDPTRRAPWQQPKARKVPKPPVGGGITGSQPVGAQTVQLAAA